MEIKSKKPALRFPEFVGEWEKKKLGEVAVFLKGKGLSKVDIIKEGKTECIRYGELYTTYGETINEVVSRTNISDKELVFSKSNDVIIPASGETQLDIATASCVVRNGIALGGDLNIIRTLNNGVFLSYYLNSEKKRDIASLSQGVSVVHLYSSQLSLLELNLPSLPEQQKIADFLTAVDKKLSLLRKKKEGLEQYKKGVMQQIFNQEIRFKPDTSTSPDTNDGSEYPEWEVKKLGEVCEIIGGGTPDTSKESYWNGEIQWFTPTEIKNDFVNSSNRTITKLGLQKSSAKILPVGTILLTTRATIGDVAITLRECATNQGFQSLVVSKSNNNVFIFNWIKRNKQELISKAKGSTFPEINKSEIENININIPSLSEQQKIAEFLTAIDKKIAKVDVQVKKMADWKKGLMQRMFC